jgi:hypothetical protein
LALLPWRSRIPQSKRRTGTRTPHLSTKRRGLVA